MKIEHLALWTFDLEGMKTFYERYFQAKAGEKYTNTKKGFASYFLRFDDGCRLELMEMPGIQPSQNTAQQQFSGLIHFAVSVGNKETVDLLTETLRRDGYNILGAPRTTGDGYYESVVSDPEGNRIEITI